MDAGAGPAAEAGGSALFVLGAVDPEMLAIEALLAAEGLPSVHATVAGKRVHPANAYRATLPEEARAQLARGGRVWLVECIGEAPAGVGRIDHHHPGDPGHGLPPAEYWRASSLGQTVAVLARELGRHVEVSPAMRLIAAADHCLGAAYRGECPGVDPAELFAWDVASRAAFEQRPEAAIRADLARAGRALAAAARVELAPAVMAADLRGQAVPELLLAAARAGQCVLTTARTRDGRTKVGCLVGSVAQVRAFMEHWAPAQGLGEIYGDPMRGFAGGYVCDRGARAKG